MFEYWFHKNEEVHHFTTNDFLQFCSDMTKHYSVLGLGEVMIALFSEQADKLDFLRVTDWNFEYSWTVPGDGDNFDHSRVILRKLK
jgi:hypothetical protein